MFDYKYLLNDSEQRLKEQLAKIPEDSPLRTFFLCTGQRRGHIIERSLVHSLKKNGLKVERNGVVQKGYDILTENTTTNKSVKFEVKFSEWSSNGWKQIRINKTEFDYYIGVTHDIDYKHFRWFLLSRETMHNDLKLTRQHAGKKKELCSCSFTKHNMNILDNYECTFPELVEKIKGLLDI